MNPMSQFYTITLPNGRRALIEAGADLTRYDYFIGFGVVRRVL